jgi:hypothetical protein
MNMSDYERLRAEVRQAREEANHNAWWIVFLLVIIAGGGFNGAALSGLIIPTLVIGAVVLVIAAVVLVIALPFWGLYRLVYAIPEIARSWATQELATRANTGGRLSRLFAIGVGLFIVSLPFIGYLLHP